MPEKPTETGSEALPKRWSAGRKAEVVVRLLRGEDIGPIPLQVFTSLFSATNACSNRSHATWDGALRSSPSKKYLAGRKWLND